MSTAAIKNTHISLSVVTYETLPSDEILTVDKLKEKPE